MYHACIGANCLDRLVKCPGSLKISRGSLEQYDKRQAAARKYTQNYIENNDATKFGMIVDEMAKNYLRWNYGVPEKRFYTKPEYETSKRYMRPANDYFKHMRALRTRFGKCFLDPVYSLSKYMDNLPTVEFRVACSPDFVATRDYKGLVYISDLTTGAIEDRNKMFQVLVCAVGIIDKYEDVTHCICEVYNSTLRTCQISKFSREELEAYRDDIIVPTLRKVRSAVDSMNDESYRHYNSWCERYCIFKSEGCQACNRTDEYVDNEVPIHLQFNYTNMSEEEKEAYKNLFR